MPTKAEPKTPRRIVGLNWQETSGVDEPANETAGWVVMKHSNVDDLLASEQEALEKARTLTDALDGMDFTGAPRDVYKAAQTLRTFLEDPADVITEDEDTETEEDPAGVPEPDGAGDGEDDGDDIPAAKSRSSIFNLVKGAVRVVLGLEKQSVEQHGTATTDGPWDADANEGRLRKDEGADYYRAAHARLDTDANPDTKSAWSFIHHEVSEDGEIGPANIRACRGAVAILNGARGASLNIAEGDRQRIYNHLARHLRDADVEPPELTERAVDGPDPETRAVKARLPVVAQAISHAAASATTREDVARAVADLLDEFVADVEADVAAQNGSG